MKNQNHFNIPPQALELAHLPTNSPLSLTIGDNTLVVRPERMTALQALNTIGTLTELTTELIESIQNACGTCEDREDGCPFVDTSSISFAPLQAAGLTHSAVSPLPAKPEGRLCGGPMRAQHSGSHGERRGKGAQWEMPEGCFPWSGLCPDEVCAADYKHDITDVPENVLPLLSMCGVCPGKLDELIMDGVEVWHG